MVAIKNWDKEERILERDMSESQTIVEDNERINMWRELIETLDSEETMSRVNEFVNILNSKKHDTVYIAYDVIEFHSNGFRINTNEMDKDKRYRFRFDGSRFEAWKNEHEELVMKELPPPNE